LVSDVRFASGDGPPDAPDSSRKEPPILVSACLAGLAVGFWRDAGEVAANWALDERFEPRMDPVRRDRLVRGWQRAVQRSLAWAEPDEPTGAPARS